MELILPTKITLKSSDIHGLGIFATKKIKKGEVIEESPFMRLPIEPGESSPLFSNYRFAWPKGEGWHSHVVGMGYASYYNHSDNPNAEWNNNLENMTFMFTALTDIKPGEEIFVYYGPETYWFDGQTKVEGK